MALLCVWLEAIPLHTVLPHGDGSPAPMTAEAFAPQRGPVICSFKEFMQSCAVAAAASSACEDSLS